MRRAAGSCKKAVLVMLLALLFLVAEVQAQLYQVPTALIEPLQPSGIRISIPDADGLELFAIHANINKPIKELESGDLSKDILQPENGRWIYQNDRIRLKPGDTVNYWLYVQKNKMGYRKDNISWTYLGNEVPPRPQGPQGPGGSFGPEQPLGPPGAGGFVIPPFTTTTIPEPLPTLPTIPLLPPNAERPRPTFVPSLPPLPQTEGGGSSFSGGSFGGGGSDVRRDEELHMLNLQLLRQILLLRREEVDAEQRRLQELHQLRLRHLEELHQEELKLLRQSQAQQRPPWRFRK